MSNSKSKKISSSAALKAALTDRQVLAMLILGMASGLPYIAVAGTLNAWLTTVGVKPVEIGLLSWALLAYAFKFLWAAALQGKRAGIGLKIGPRRMYMAFFLTLVVISMAALTFSNPPNNLAIIGLISIVIAIFSASFDIVLAAWRIESARDDRHLDLLSSVEQIGYRTASLLGGFVALLLADKIGWKYTFMSGTALLALSGIGIWLAAPSPQSQVDGEVNGHEFTRNIHTRQAEIGTVLVLIGWVFGFYLIAQFMHGALTDPINHKATSFIRNQGPLVVGSTVVWLGVVAGALVWLNDRQEVEQSEQRGSSGILGVMGEAILIPMIELVSRLRWASILVVLLVLSYRFTDLIWGGFAYPFYLGENYGALGHTLTEVGFASKLMGIFATMIGIAIGGAAMLIFGRMPVFFVGAVLAALTNLLFADLALGATYTDKALILLQLDHLYEAFGLDMRMARLTSVIFAENLAVGLASAASVAYLSSIVNKSYAAVQYALLVSLVFLLGVLGRPTIGVIIENDGFARAFVICAWLGGFAVVLSLIEWIRVAKNEKKAKS